MGIRKGRGKVYGKGTNDGISTFCINSEGKRVKCAIYAKWSDMLRRCYNEADLIKDPCYTGVTVCEEWLTYSNFHKWISSQVDIYHNDLKQDQLWRSLNLDKDLLLGGNMEYSPESCILLHNKINKLIMNKVVGKGLYPIGVSLHGVTYASHCGVDSSQKYLGAFATPHEAHRAWQKVKYNEIIKNSIRSTDERVKTALVNIANRLQFDMDNNLETVML